MSLSKRIALMAQLGQYIQQNDEEWQAQKHKAFLLNGWFIPDFIDLSIQNIVHSFLQEQSLKNWIAQYPLLQEENTNPKQIGIVMAGNIPLVGFHDFLCVFLSGNNCLIKTSSKDEVLIKHLIGKLIEWEPTLCHSVTFSFLLKNCNAYIATGSNSTANYFEYYFGKYPNIIRKNRTSVAVLTGKETKQDLEWLADDVFQYFGMGCRNITQIFVPQHYNFEPMLEMFKKYNYLSDHHKYKNNYDYNLALHILNNKFYMSTPALLLIENENIFSPISQINYQFYIDKTLLENQLTNNEEIQCIVGESFIPFGAAQQPTLFDYADGVDTMAWLQRL